MPKRRSVLPNRPDSPPLRRLPARERERLLTEAQKHSRRLQSDLKEQAILDELEHIQADNSDADQ
jgi:hypothetical protein